MRNYFIYSDTGMKEKQMLLEKGNPAKKNNGKLVVGYDLGDYVSQISYGFCGEGEPETLSTVAGGENYNIPTLLAKRANVNQWFYGKDAKRAAREGEGILVENLLSLAKAKEPVTIEGNTFEPAAMLALFMKRTMGLLSMVAPIEKIDVFVVTVDVLDREMVEVLNHAVAAIGLKTDAIYFQSHMESFYYYMIFQPKELWNHQVLLYDFGDASMKSYCLACNNRTTPIVAFIDEEEFEDMRRPIVSATEEMEPFSESYLEGLDRVFSGIVEQTGQDRIVSSAYLIGEGFQGEWAKESLKILCRNKRVFQGNNLYSKGACYSGLEKIAPTDNGKSHVFLGNEKLKANIGMKVLRQGEESYLALLDAGINWFEAEKECEFILESGNTVAILITPLNGRQIQEVVLQMEGLLERPERTTRVHMHIFMNREHEAMVELTDLGFGELFAASKQTWREAFEV